MHVMLMFDHTTLKAAHLAGRPKTLTIERVAKGEVRNGKSKATKPLIYFRGHQLPLVCGKTVAKVIIAMYGPDTATWAGKQVTIYPTVTQGAEGDSVECIRVRPGIPQTPQGAPEPASPQLPAGQVHDAEFEEAR